MQYQCALLGVNLPKYAVNTERPAMMLFFDESIRCHGSKQRGVECDCKEGSDKHRSMEYSNVFRNFAAL
jgi:hypothetical protein